uniref:Monocyte to macrophage differentiation factor 2 n=1 Tax=Hymenolepis diminuta TaxID=6216 RepID=A0A0R3SK97_HYMDI
LREFEMDMGQMMLKVIWSTAILKRFLQKDRSGMGEMLLGGVVYTTGTFFYRMDGRIPLAHAIWHCFVTLAAFIHFYATEYHLFSH